MGIISDTVAVRLGVDNVLSQSAALRRIDHHRSLVGARPQVLVLDRHILQQVDRASKQLRKLLPKSEELGARPHRRRRRIEIYEEVEVTVLAELLGRGRSKEPQRADPILATKLRKALALIG